MNPKTTSHIVSCSVVLNEIAPLAARSCVTTAKTTTTKIKTLVTLSADIRKPFLRAVLPDPFDVTEVVAMAIPPTFRFGSTTIHFDSLGAACPVLDEIVPGTGTEVPVYTAAHEVAGAVRAWSTRPEAEPQQGGRHSSTRAALIYQHATRDCDQAIAKALGGLVQQVRATVDPSIGRNGHGS